MSGPDQINGLMIKVHGISKFGSTEEPTICISKQFTSCPVGMCLASFTLAKLPFPIVFNSLYLPTYTSSPGGLELWLVFNLPEDPLLPPELAPEAEEGRWWRCDDPELEEVWCVCEVWLREEVVPRCELRWGLCDRWVEWWLLSFCGWERECWCVQCYDTHTELRDTCAQE